MPYYGEKPSADEKIAGVPVATLYTIGNVGRNLSEDQNIVVSAALPVRPTLEQEPLCYQVPTSLPQTRRHINTLRVLNELSGHRLIALENINNNPPYVFREAQLGTFAMLKSFCMPLQFPEIPVAMKREVLWHPDVLDEHEKLGMLELIHVCLRHDFFNIDVVWEPDLMSPNFNAAKARKALFAGPKLKQFPETAKELFAHRIGLDWLVYGKAFSSAEFIDKPIGQPRREVMRYAEFVLKQVGLHD